MVLVVLSEQGEHQMPTAEDQEISILRVERERVTFTLISTTPLIYHRVGQKAQRELLLPRAGRKTPAEKAASFKHYPLIEYRDSVYRCKADLNQDTRLVFPAEAFHQAMSDAALDLPGLKKAQIGRLCGVDVLDVSIYGVPQLFMTVVRNSDQNHTPDIRTRAVLPKWGCQVSIWFAKPLLRRTSIIDLMASAGIYIGIGDYRQQKGAGSFGLWDVVDSNDAEFKKLQKNCGREAQDRALENPAFFDDQTRDLFEWCTEEMARRTEQRPIKVGKRSKQTIEDEEVLDAAE